VKYGLPELKGMCSDSSHTNYNGMEVTGGEKWETRAWRSCAARLWGSARIAAQGLVLSALGARCPVPCALKGGGGGFAGGPAWSGKPGKPMKAHPMPKSIPIPSAAGG
jgi:hypothetical protein